MTFDDAKMSFTNFVNAYDQNANLLEIHNAFLIEKMKRDKEFSLLLDEWEDDMNKSETYDSQGWKEYRAKLKEYDAVESYVKQSKYYLNKHVR